MIYRKKLEEPAGLGSLVWLLHSSVIRTSLRQRHWVHGRSQTRGPRLAPQLCYNVITAVNIIDDDKQLLGRNPDGFSPSTWLDGTITKDRDSHYCVNGLNELKPGLDASRLKRLIRVCFQQRRDSSRLQARESPARRGACG